MTGADSPVKILIVLVIALIVLGPKRLPEAGRSLGSGIREFKDAIAGIGVRETPECPLDPPDKNDASGIQDERTDTRGG